MSRLLDHIAVAKVI